MRGRMADLPTFDAYNVQYRPPTSMLHHESISPRGVVYNRTFLDDSLTPSGDGGPSFGSNNDQVSFITDSTHIQLLNFTYQPPVYRSPGSACAVQSPYFWQNGIAPEGSLEPIGCAATSETSTVAYPTSTNQGHSDYLLHREHIQPSTIAPLPHSSDPFHISARVVHEMDGLATTQIWPAEACIPNQLVPSFRHTTVCILLRMTKSIRLIIELQIPQLSVPSMKAILDPATIHMAAVRCLHSCSVGY